MFLIINLTSSRLLFYYHKASIKSTKILGAKIEAPADDHYGKIIKFIDDYCREGNVNADDSDDELMNIGGNMMMI